MEATKRTLWPQPGQRTRADAPQHLLTPFRTKSWKVVVPLPMWTIERSSFAKCRRMHPRCSIMLQMGQEALRTLWSPKRMLRLPLHMRMTEVESGSPRETAIAVGEQRCPGQTFPPAALPFPKSVKRRPGRQVVHPKGAIKDEGRAANRPSTANATASRDPGPPLQMSQPDQPEWTE